MLPSRSVRQGVVIALCLPKTAWPPTWKEKQERKEKGKKRVEEISQDEREKIREEGRRKIMPPIVVMTLARV